MATKAEWGQQGAAAWCLARYQRAPFYRFELTEEPHLHTATLWPPPWPRLSSLNTTLRCRPRARRQSLRGARSRFVVQSVPR